MVQESFDLDVSETERSGYLRRRFPSVFWQIYDQYFRALFLGLISTALFLVWSSPTFGVVFLALALLSAFFERRLFRLAPLGSSESSASIANVSAAFKRLGWIVDLEHEVWVSALTSDRSFSSRPRVTVVKIGRLLFFNSHPSNGGLAGSEFRLNLQLLEAELTNQPSAGAVASIRPDSG